MGVKLVGGSRSQTGAIPFLSQIDYATLRRESDFVGQHGRLGILHTNSNRWKSARSVARSSNRKTEPYE